MVAKDTGALAPRAHRIRRLWPNYSAIVDRTIAATHPFE